MLKELAILTLTAFIWETSPALQPVHADPHDPPEKVRTSLEAKFPGAVIGKWTKEHEGGIEVFDIEFTKGGRHYEADITGNGVIQNWEQAVGPDDLPKAARSAVEKLYPGCALVEIMQTMAVKDGKDLPEGFEVSLKTRDKKKAEVTVSPDGKILEDSGAKK